MSQKTITVEAVRLASRTALSDNNRIGKITNLLASDGSETNDPEQAQSFVVKWSENEWTSHKADDFQPIQTN